LKLATSLDGRIATSSGESRWITGPQAREAVHHLRAGHDAVLVGIETVLADNPDLTVRVNGYAGPQPSRVVLDTRQRMPVDGGLALSARDVPVYVITTHAPSPALAAVGVKVLQVVSGDDSRPSLKATVDQLAGQGLKRILVEGGGQVAGSFLRCDLIDAIEWFRAPIVLGDEGRPAIGALALAALADAPRFRRIEMIGLGDDLWERYERI